MDTPKRPSHEEVGVGAGTGEVADVRPLDVTGVRTVSVGAILFLLASLVLVLFFRDWMDETGREWWLWTCVTGFGLGIFGYDHCRRRARHHAEASGGPGEHA